MTDRIRKLLAERDAAERALAEAVTPAHAADARADLHSIAHSLWLAGYQHEEAA